MSSTSMCAARLRFAAAINRADEEISLAEAALWLAAEEYPRMDVSVYLERLHEFGELARRNAANCRGPRQTIAAINHVGFEELGFHGNRDNYYDPRNSYLNEVIDRRTGIPITLTIVYMDIARTAGLELKGVGLPAHFIAKHVGESQEIYIDPFNCGEVMGYAGCEQLLNKVTGGKAQLKPEDLRAVTARQVLTRTLSNLLGIYSKSDYRRALAVVERLLIVNPDSPSYIRDRGLLLARLGETKAARAELERYLELEPAAPDADLILYQLKAIKQKQARWN